MIINVQQKLMKIEDLLEGSATVVDDLIWQGIARRLQELFVIGIVSLGIFQVSVIRETTTCCTSGHPLAQLMAREMKLPIISVTINNSLRRALVDTGCTTTIVHSSVADQCKTIASYVTAFDGSIVGCRRRGGLEMEVGER